MSGKRDIILSILKYLRDQMNSQESSADTRESLEVAIQCIEAAYEMEGMSDAQLQGATDLNSLFNVEDDTQKKAAAESHKIQGNELMRQGQYMEALQEYNRAIALDGNNAIYYCNRAAAHSRLENDQEAINDCRKAVALNPDYAKAYSRLGIALSSQNLHEDAREAFRQAHMLEPSNLMYETNFKLAEERLRGSTSTQAAASSYNVDIGDFITNPHILNVASQMLNNPGIRDVISNLIDVNRQAGGDPVIQPNLLQVSQQLAQQIQASYPGLVDNLRQRLTTNEEGTATDSSQSNDNLMDDNELDDDDNEDDQPT